MIRYSGHGWTYLQTIHVCLKLSHCFRKIGRETQVAKIYVTSLLLGATVSASPPPLSIRTHCMVDWLGGLQWPARRKRSKMGPETINYGKFIFCGTWGTKASLLLWGELEAVHKTLPPTPLISDMADTAPVAAKTNDEDHDSVLEAHLYTRSKKDEKEHYRPAGSPDVVVPLMPTTAAALSSRNLGCPHKSACLQSHTINLCMMYD